MRPSRGHLLGELGARVIGRQDIAAQGALDQPQRPLQSQSPWKAGVCGGWTGLSSVFMVGKRWGFHGIRTRLSGPDQQPRVWLACLL